MTPTNDRLLCNAVQLNQILMNLAVNAKDAMHSKGQLIISLDWATEPDIECLACHKIIQGNWIELKISDTGTGIAPEFIPEIFIPFFTTKEKTKGTGLGLSVVHGIVESWGGHIIIDTELGKGTTFRLLFSPVDESYADKEENAHETHKPDTVDSNQNTDKHIMVVDDEQALAIYLTDLLELFGYKVTAWTDSLVVAALSRNELDYYDLLITDQTMPGMNGFELSKNIREKVPGFPVILVTGYSDQVDEIKANKHQIGYMRKLIDSDRLLEILEELFANKTA